MNEKVIDSVNYLKIYFLRLFLLTFMFGFTIWFIGFGVYFSNPNIIFQSQFWYTILRLSFILSLCIELTLKYN